MFKHKDNHRVQSIEKTLEGLGHVSVNLAHKLGRYPPVGKLVTEKQCGWDAKFGEKNVLKYIVNVYVNDKIMIGENCY